MIDLHSHLLPGVDDGSRTVEQSVGVLCEMSRQGITDVCLTPHLLASRASKGVPPAQDAAFTVLRAAAPPEVRLHRGAEVMLDRPLSNEIAAARRITLGGTRYILVEFPRLVAARTVYQALTLLTETGLVPLVAHPERYACCAPETVRHWKGTGALMQVDATALLSGRSRGERARRLVSEGLADVAAADNHGDSRSLAAGQQVLADHGGSRQAELLMTENPRAILDDRPAEPVPPVSFRTSIVQRIRWLFDEEDS